MPYQKLDSIRMKEINTLALIDVLRRHGRISRRDLAEKTGLTLASITNFINELIDKGYVCETGSGVSAGGRKPGMLELNSRAGYVIGVELNTANAVCLLCDFQAGVIDRMISRIEISAGPQNTIEVIADMVLRIVEQNGLESGQIFGVGLVSAGPFDCENGVMINPPNFPGWLDVPIRDLVQRGTGIRTYFERESFAAALGEYWFGQEGRSKRLLFINVYEVGLGGGFVIDGEIYHGFRDGSMEIGHMSVQPDGHPCACGNMGCLEVQAAGTAAQRYAQEMMAQGQDSKLREFAAPTLSDLILCAENGDAVSIRAIGRCAQYLGKALGSLVRILSPDAIYFGGPFMCDSTLLFEKTIAVLDAEPHPPHIRQIKKACATFGIESCAMGAVALVFQHLFSVDGLFGI